MERKLTSTQNLSLGRRRAGAWRPFGNRPASGFGPSVAFSEGLSKPLADALRNFHHVRAPDQPIYAHIETVCDLADTIKIESAQSCKLKIKESGDHQFRCYGVVHHTTNAAGFGKAVTKEVKVC
jgi:hypothetical protein